MNNSIKIAIALLATLGIVGVGYAIYFDRKRVTDPAFRRSLKKHKKKVIKEMATQKKNEEDKLNDELDKALENIGNTNFPNDPEQREKFFMEQVAQGEALTHSGSLIEAAICFYKGLKVYPSPADLIILYQSTIQKDVFSLIMGLMSLDVRKKSKNYFKVFPPVDMNVRFAGYEQNGKEMPDMENVVAIGEAATKWYLAVTKNFQAGNVIYSEDAIVAALFPSLENGSLCSYCLRNIVSTEENKAIRCGQCDLVVYCSEKCRSTDDSDSHACLCTQSANLESGSEHGNAKWTREFHAKAVEDNEVVPVLLAKFFSHMIFEESRKFLANEHEDFTLWDHVERMPMASGADISMDVVEEMKRLRRLIGAQVEGLNEFITEERYVMLKRKFMHNVYAVCAKGEFKEKGECAVAKSEYPRSVMESGKVVGMALFQYSSYVHHSCQPNARMEISEKDNGCRRMTLVAVKDIKEGERLTVDYLSASVPDGERAKALKKWYGVHCQCEKCAGGPNKEDAQQVDGSCE